MYWTDSFTNGMKSTNTLGALLSLPFSFPSGGNRKGHSKRKEKRHRMRTLSHSLIREGRGYEIQVRAGPSILPIVVRRGHKNGHASRIGHHFRRMEEEERGEFLVCANDRHQLERAMHLMSRRVSSTKSPYLVHTMVGGRRGVENRSAGGGIRIFAPSGGGGWGWGENFVFVLQEGGRERGGQNPKSSVGLYPSGVG